MLNRRSLLAATTAVGVGAGLSACRSGSDGPTGGSGGGGGGSASDVTPTYTEFTGVEADLPGDAELGIPNGFYTYPDAPQKVTEYPLPETEPISILSQGITANVSRNESNWWKMLQADLGNELPTTVILSTQYNEKFQTLVAGDQLPDLVQMVSTPELPKLLEAKFTDLGEFIGGDKVAQYPGLASIP
ncbi:MAG TPA: hypothetical protein IAA98_13495, partial [Candidatus Avipropionibacterium avicola]|nr:hypothetical protein [Candidatus Avipropionibacterium avicola]